jgi:hypothetical protein
MLVLGFQKAPKNEQDYRKLQMEYIICDFLKDFDLWKSCPKMNNLLQNLLLLQRIGHKCRVFWEGEVFVV